MLHLCKGLLDLHAVGSWVLKVALQITSIDCHTFVPALLGPSPLVVDLGTNRGHFALAMIDRFDAKVCGAEPDAGLFFALPEHPSLTVTMVAMGRSSGTATLFNTSGCDASLLPNLYGRPAATTAQVRVSCLSEFLDMNGVGCADLLKVDIEGAECDLLETANQNDLLRFGQIAVEFHDFLLPSLGGRVKAIKRRIARIGFHRINFSRNNGDVLFIRRDLIAEREVVALRIHKYAVGLFRIGRRVVGRWA